MYEKKIIIGEKIIAHMNNNINIQQQIAQLNIFLAPHRIPGNHNGYYSLVYHRELDGICRIEDLKESDFRVLLYIIAHAGQDNRINVDVKEICDALPISVATVYRALQKLIKMQLICRAKSEDKRVFELTTKLINPRLALYGDDYRFIKEKAPRILLPDGLTPLLESDVNQFDIDKLFDSEGEA